MADDFHAVVLSENALALHISGEFVTVQNSGSVHVVAAVKLGENDHIKLE
jgi:hypothetical protein